MVEADATTFIVSVRNTVSIHKKARLTRIDSSAPAATIDSEVGALFHARQGCRSRPFLKFPAPAPRVLLLPITLVIVIVIVTVILILIVRVA